MDYKILVTGSKGQLGNYLFKLLSSNFNVVGTSRCSYDNKNNYILDITNSKDVKLLISKIKPNIIINTAAITDVDYCETNKNKSHSVNVEGLRNLLKHSNLDTKIIQISSDFIYDGKKHKVNEETLPNPLNYYGKNKLEAENILHSSNRKYLVIRISTLFSNYLNNFFTFIYDSLTSNTKINIVADQIVNPSYVPFLSKTILDLILLDAEGIYNYGTYDHINKYDFAVKIADYFNLDKTLITKVNTNKINSFIAERPLDCSMDCSYIGEKFNINLPYVNDCLQDLKSNYYE